MSYSTLVNGARVRLATHTPAILGARFDDLTVNGVVNYKLAARMRDVVVIHNTVFSSLPAGTPVDPKDLTYVAFTNNVTNEELILATAWIDEGSIESLSNQELRFKVLNSATGDVDRIRSILRESGFTVEFIS